jgi:putative sugar O-methyltransferase
MSFKASILSALNSLLGKADINLVSKSQFNYLQSLEYKFQHLTNRFGVSEQLLFSSSHSDADLPADANSYLQFNNPRLRELKNRYQALSHPVIDPSQWTEEFVNQIEKLQFFRGDYVYVWQYKNINTELHYWLTTSYLQARDKLGLLSVLTEDSLFGCHSFHLNDNLTVSRDLLDSIIEIYFLEQTIEISQIPNVKILDIGAGYGRLAHRIVKSLPNVEKVFCVDAIAESTFISEYYLRFRGVDEKAVVIPLDELDNLLLNHQIDLAINIHSFSECTLATITAWLDILQKHKVKYFMVVPNSPKLLSTEKDGQHPEFLPVIQSRGYELVVHQPKYLDPVLQKHGVSPTYHYLFKFIQ